VAQNVDAVSPIELMSPIVALVRVEIWSDVVCPWCFIGKRRFDNAVAQLREKGVTEPIDIVFKAYQLDPTAPVGSPTPVLDAYAMKFGGRERAEQILQHVTSVAAGDDITFNMDIALRANTILCHRALHWVLEQHGPLAQAAFKENLLLAYFTEGKDVGDIEVIIGRATDLGYDGTALRTWLDDGGGIEEVESDIRGAYEREVTGVPAFFIDDKYFIPGAQETEVFLKVLERILSQ
jgi:predicted DsbA family dithiol-disulfide isomerase